jgi:hypothetical protein
MQMGQTDDADGFTWTPDWRNIFQLRSYLNIMLCKTDSG